MAFGEGLSEAIGLPIAGELPSALAPPPIVDRFPIISGAGLSLAYISVVFRIATTGLRQQYVDLLDEMLEKDPHAYSVVSKRALGVANGRLEVVAAKAEAGSADAQKAEEIRANYEQQLHAIPDREQHLASLAWGVYYGISGTETHWARDGRGWLVDHLSFIHSRRLSYPRPGSWDLHVWDQGQVGSLFGLAPTNGLYGLRIGDYPGKFIIHAPQVRGDYPTREGLGRQIAYWMALKLVASRGAPKYLERFASPWPEATYATGDDGKPGRKASKEDINEAGAALKAMGGGALNSWVHADTIALKLTTPEIGGTPKVTYAEWINLCDAQISKAGLGGTLTTEVGSSGGNRALGETQKKGETTLLRQDAKLLAASWDRHLTAHWVRLNYGEESLRLAPRVVIHIEDDPDPMQIIERAAKAAASGLPVDADWLADEVGLKLVEAGKTEARRMLPYLGVKAPEVYDADLAARVRAIETEFGPTEAEKAAQAKQQAAALQKKQAAGDQPTNTDEPEPGTGDNEGENEDAGNHSDAAP